MKIEVSETSAVIVLDQTNKESTFQLFLPGEMEYDDAPANVKMAVVLTSLLHKGDEDFHNFILSMGREEYIDYFSKVVRK
jgi:hypothetical protein